MVTEPSGYGKADRKRFNPLLLFLLAFLIFNVCLDACLTDYALHGDGYYETNRFTNTFGLHAHALSLCLIFATYYIVCVVHGLPYTRSVFLVLNLVWVLNNIFSIKMLWF